MPDSQENTSASVDPVLIEAPSVTIRGVKYPLRRLGLTDVFKVARIMGHGLAGLTDAPDGISGGQVVQVLVAAMIRSEDEVLSLIASLIGVTRADLEDADRFGMDALVEVIDALSRHQDLLAFFASISKLMVRLPEMQTRLGEHSNS